MMKLVKSKINVRICITFAKRYSNIVWYDTESYYHENTKKKLIIIRFFKTQF